MMWSEQPLNRSRPHANRKESGTGDTRERSSDAVPHAAAVARSLLPREKAVAFRTFHWLPSPIPLYCESLRRRLGSYEYRPLSFCELRGVDVLEEIGKVAVRMGEEPLFDRARDPVGHL